MKLSAVAESTVQEKSPWDSNAVLMIFCTLQVLSLNSAIFQKHLVVLPPPTLNKVEIWEKFWIHPSNLVCGSGRVGGGRLVMYDLKRAPQKQMCSKMFVHDCRYRRCFAHVASIYANLLVQKKAFT